MPTLEEKLVILDNFIKEIKEMRGVEPKEPKIGTKYWYVGSCGKIEGAGWDNGQTDFARLKAGNVFWEEENCDDEILRRESMAERGEEPEKRDKVWFWSFQDKICGITEYNNCFYSHYTIGNIHSSEKACKEWGDKYSKAFLNLRK